MKNKTKKVIAIIGTQSRKATYKAAQEFEKNLKLHGEIDFEYVFLHEYDVGFCRGCKQCFLKGEEFCPLKDDRDVILEKIEHADGVVLATPTYAFQVTARVKNLFDRMAFIDHRPRFFGKTFVALAIQGFYGGEDVLKYVNFAAENMGFSIVKGCCLSALDPMTKNQVDKMAAEIKKVSDRFYQGLLRPPAPPSLLRLFIFRWGRTNIQTTLDDSFRDYQYYKKMGWFESDYFYPTSLGPVKHIAGRFFDFIGKRISKSQ